MHENVRNSTSHSDSIFPVFLSPPRTHQRDAKTEGTDPQIIYLNGGTSCKAEVAVNGPNSMSLTENRSQRVREYWRFGTLEYAKSTLMGHLWPPSRSF